MFQKNEKMEQRNCWRWRTDVFKIIKINVLRIIINHSEIKMEKHHFRYFFFFSLFIFVLPVFFSPDLIYRLVFKYVRLTQLTLSLNDKWRRKCENVFFSSFYSIVLCPSVTCNDEHRETIETLIFSLFYAIITLLLIILIAYLLLSHLMF